jgi:hypothetical protein
VLYANKVNPSVWQDVNQVEQFGFLSTACPGEPQNLFANQAPKEPKSNRFIW